MRRDLLISYLDKASEDELIEEVLMPLFRQLGFQRITAAGHKDKALEYGKDIWMRYTLPTQHVLYFGLQVKRDKLDASGASNLIGTLLQKRAADKSAAMGAVPGVSAGAGIDSSFPPVPSGAPAVVPNTNAAPEFKSKFNDFPLPPANANTGFQPMD